MVVMYKFQLAGLRRYLRLAGENSDMALVGGRVRKGRIIVRSIYRGISSREEILALMDRKGETYLGDAVFGIHMPEIGEDMIAGTCDQPGKICLAIGCGTDTARAFVCRKKGVVKEKTVMDETDVVDVRKAGMLFQTDEGYYSMRIKVTAGNISSGDWKNMAVLAERYGKGDLHVTSRQGVEIPFVHVSDLDDFVADMTSFGFVLGASGPRVRGVVACQGDFVCRNGLIDSSKLAEKLAQRFWGRDLPYKFKIGVTGCPANCLKADENDLGVKGIARVEWQETGCVFCGACARACPRDAITVDREDQLFSLDQSVCIDCGKCARACPYGSIRADMGYRVTVGGTFARDIIIGQVLEPFVRSGDEVMRLAEGVVDYYQHHGKSGERLAVTLQRMGIESLQNWLKKRVEKK